MEKQNSIAEKIIIGSILTLGLAEAAHLAALFLDLSFSACTIIMAVLFLGGFLFACIRLFLCRRAAKEKNTAEKSPEGVSAYTLLRAYPVWTMVFAGVVLFQVIWNFWMHNPCISQDITGETVQTMLFTDTIYKINPFTGQAFSAGMPLRLKILVLPTLYGAVCKWTGLHTTTVCYQIMPMLVLLLSYLVYSRLAVYFFPKQGKKQLWFMLFVALIYQFGCYSQFTDGFLLFFKGGQGDAFRACVLLPFALLCCLRSEWKKVVLCLLAEVCVVWTFYGLGYVALTVLVICIIRFIKYLADRRKKV